MADFFIKLLDRLLTFLLAFKSGRDSSVVETVTKENQVLNEVLKSSKETEKRVKEMTVEELWDEILSRNVTDADDVPQQLRS